MLKYAYGKGKKKEYKVMQQAVLEGNYPVRSAGSHGIFDVIVIDHIHKRIELIQVKSGDYFTDKDREKLLKQYSFFNGTYEVEFAVN